MPVFCEKKGHKLRVYGVDVPEFPLEEPADESAIYPIITFSIDEQP